MPQTLKPFLKEGQAPRQAGKFIVIEGVDGSGKGEQMCRLAAWLYRRNKNYHILMTREPSLSEHGELVRRLLATATEVSSYAREFLRLFVEDRADHIKRLIQPMLKYGCIVLCDRYKHSTIAYQEVQGIPFEEIAKAHEGFLVPDMTIILDIDPRIALTRNLKDTSRKYQEVFEREVEFTEKMRKKYLELPKRLPNERIEIVDANKTPEMVFESVCKIVEKIL
jgi:dTMP kinase